MSEQMPTTDGLHIVLFGAAGAGKSSLLGALAQASHTQGQVLGSQLTDVGGGLAELQKRTYDGKQTETQEETVAYPVSLEGAVPATLVDCDGRVAQDYLSGQRSLDESSALAGAIKQADALILAVAPGDTAQLEQAFSQFTQFLKLLEVERGRLSEIAGLPVYLVLTKCDLYAKKDDLATAWMQKIEDAKRKLGKRFEDFLLRSRAVPFGRIDLHLWATAVKRPQLADRPARPHEPYGVAELFRQVIGSARAFQDQQARAHRQLHVAVMGLVGLILVMALLATGFFWIRPSAELAALENAVHAALPTPTTAEGTIDAKTLRAAARELLRDPVAKETELVKILDKPEFTHLPAKLQDDVRQAHEEVVAYLELGKQIVALKPVGSIKKEEDIQTFTREIDRIVLPPKYAAQWADTRLPRKIQQYRSELAALTKALTDEKDWLKKQTEEGEKLRRMAIPAEGSPERQAWINRAEAFLKRKDLTKDVPGVPYMKLWALYDFPSVSSLREDYETVRPRVEKIRGGL